MVVKERLGHASIQTTERYLHTLDNADDTALAALAKVRSGTSAVPSDSMPREPGDIDQVSLQGVLGQLAEMQRLIVRLTDDGEPTSS